MRKNQNKYKMNVVNNIKRKLMNCSMKSLDYKTKLTIKIFMFKVYRKNYKITNKTMNHIKTKSKTYKDFVMNKNYRFRILISN